MKAMLASLSLALLCLAALAAAQEKPVPPPRDFEPDTEKKIPSQLPIQLPNYVIVGSDLIRLDAGKSEQPSPPSGQFTARLGVGQRESRFHEVAPLRRPLEPHPLAGNRHTLLARVGLGRFATPYAEAWLQNDFSTADLTAHLRFEHSDGHVPHADYSQFGFDLTAGSYIPKSASPLLARSRVQGAALFERHQYELFGKGSQTGFPDPAFERTIYRASYGVELLSRHNAVLDHDARVSVDHFILHETMSVDDGFPPDTDSQGEHSIGLEARASQTIAMIPLEASLRFSVAPMSSGGENVHNPFFFRIGLQSSYRLRNDLVLEGGLRFQLFRGTDGNTQGRLFPSAQLRYELDPFVRVFASAEAAVREKNLRTLFEQNPYTSLSAGVRHEIQPVHLRLGTEYDDRARLSARLYVDYTASTSYAYFQRMSARASKLWDVRYDDGTSVSALHGDISWRISHADQCIGQATFRGSHSDALAAAIPYLPDFEISGAYVHQCSLPLKLTATIRMTGSREADNGRLPLFLNAGAEAEYWWTEHIGAFASISNAINQRVDLWDGYPERPFFLMLGITGTW